jgi:hypothetical protein
MQRRYLVVGVELQGDTVICSLIEPKQDTPEPKPTNKGVTTIQELERQIPDDDMKRMAKSYFEAAMEAMPFLANIPEGRSVQIRPRYDMMFRFTVEEWETLGRPGLFSELILEWSSPSL